MPNFVEQPNHYGPEDPNESLNEVQDDNHSTPNYTSNGGSNGRNSYAPPAGPVRTASEFGTGAEGHKITQGIVFANDGAKTFCESKRFMIYGGKHTSSNDWQRNGPNVGPSEIYTHSDKHTIRGGEFDAIGNASMFNHASNGVIHGGTFRVSGNASAFVNTRNFEMIGGTFGASGSSASHSSTQYPAPVNYGTAQGYAPQRTSQGQQGYDSRARPFSESESHGYMGNSTQTSTEFQQTRSVTMDSKSITLKVFVTRIKKKVNRIFTH